MIAKKIYLNTNNCYQTINKKCVDRIENSQFAVKRFARITTIQKLYLK